nr:FCD domain-containing protein [Pseudonocardia acidicola]
MRAALEPRLTARAVPRAGADDIEALDALAHRMLDVGAPGAHQDLDALVPLNRDFHRRLVTLADHPALATALAGAIHAPIVLRNFHTYDDASLRRSLAHHLEIVAAVRAGDPEWARAVMTAHIHNARAVMVRAAAEQQEDA